MAGIRLDQGNAADLSAIGARIALWPQIPQDLSVFASLRLCVKSVNAAPTPSCRFLKIICPFGGQISPCLWVGNYAHPLKHRTQFQALVACIEREEQ